MTNIRYAFGLGTNRAGGGASPQSTKKSSEIELWDETDSWRVARAWERRGGPALLLKRGRGRGSCESVKFYKSQPHEIKLLCRRASLWCEDGGNNIWKFLEKRCAKKCHVQSVQFDTLLTHRAKRRQFVLTTMQKLCGGLLNTVWLRSFHGYLCISHHSLCFWNLL